METQQDFDVIFHNRLRIKNAVLVCFSILIFHSRLSIINGRSQLEIGTTGRIRPNWHEVVVVGMVTAKEKGHLGAV